ncbi:MAG: HEAT repeat domain-containing protein [Labilithrix sp.]|nr:HEAT repeat domain-containing protein [Labilithrix sp.]
MRSRRIASSRSRRTASRSGGARLGRAGASRADLEGGLRDAHPAVRVACAAGLGNIGDPASIPALERAMKGESYATVKTAMKDTVTKIRGTPSSERRAEHADLARRRALRGAARRDEERLRRPRRRPRRRHAPGGAREGRDDQGGAMGVDGSDPTVMKKAAERRIPVLQVDGNLTRLTQVTGTDGATVISAKVDMSIRKMPGQTPGARSAAARPRATARARRRRASWTSEPRRRRAVGAPDGIDGRRARRALEIAPPAEPAGGGPGRAPTDRRRARRGRRSIGPRRSEVSSGPAKATEDRWKCVRRSSTSSRARATRSAPRRRSFRRTIRR